MCLFFGTVLFLITFFFSQTLAGLLGATGELQKLTADYIKGYGLCCLFSMLSATYIPFLQLDCTKLLSTVSIVTMVGLNIVFNRINAMVLNLGMVGVGLAASLATCISVLICLPHFFRKSKLFSIDLKGFSFADAKHICKLGFNSAIQFVWITIGDRILIQALLNLGGNVAIAAYTIANNISNSIGSTIQGGAEGSANLVSGVLVGGRDVKSLRKLPTVIVETATPVFVLAYVFFFVFAKQFAFAFGAEPEHIELYVMAIRFYNLWFLTNAIKISGFSIYNSIGKISQTGVYKFLSLGLYPSIIYLISF